AVSGLVLAAVIAERERAESEREHLIREQSGVEARLRLAAIVESSDEAILSADLDGLILSWNAAAHRIFGYTEAEAIGRPVMLLIPPDRRGEETTLRQRLSAGERIVHFETIRMTKGGALVNVALTMSPLRNAEGEIIGMANV